MAKTRNKKTPTKGAQDGAKRNDGSESKANSYAGIGNPGMFELPVVAREADQTLGKLCRDIYQAFLQGNPRKMHDTLMAVEKVRDQLAGGAASAITQHVWKVNNGRRAMVGKAALEDLDFWIRQWFPKAKLYEEDHVVRFIELGTNLHGLISRHTGAWRMVTRSREEYFGDDLPGLAAVVGGIGEEEAVTLLADSTGVEFF